jgi:sensor c-di-GMP phosphodiesterase-like protein
MYLKRSRVIAEAIILAFIGVLLPLSVAIYAAWALSVNTEKGRLELVASQAAARTHLSILSTAATLRELDHQRQLAACSDTHISEMRRLTINSRMIEEIGYFDEGLLRCTSWGVTMKRIAKLPPEFMSGDDIETWVAVAPLVSGADPLTVVQVGKHNALIDPVRPIDLLSDNRIRITIVAPNGRVAAMLNDSDTQLALNLAKQGKSGVTDDYVYGVSVDAGWTAIAVGHREELIAQFRSQLWIFLLFGAFASIIIVALILRQSRKRHSPLSELQIAVRKREFLVHYQPIVELATGNCVGAEALVRWKRPDGSLVRPDLFIPLAEQSGLIQPITDQVLEAVARDLNELLVQYRSMHVTINVCADDIKTGRILDAVATRIGRTGIENRQIWLEATERGLLDIKEASRTIAEARRRGHKVAIDDFGTGYSSLQYLQDLPLDTLKIDKSFINTINRQSATSSVVPHIIDMAKTLKLSIVAEGVETVEQAEYLIEHGVEHGQGWHYGKPMPADIFITYLYENMKRRRADIIPLKRSNG